MPDLLTHLAVGYLIASRVYKPWHALLASVVALLPDVDVLFGVHRWLTHSLVVHLVIAVVAVVVVTKLKPKQMLNIVALLAALASHIVLDLFTAHTPILWPLNSSHYMVQVEVTGILMAGRLVEISSIVEVDSTYTDSAIKDTLEGPIASSLGVMVSLAVATMVVLEHAVKRRPAKDKQAAQAIRAFNEVGINPKPTDLSRSQMAESTSISYSLKRLGVVA